jgi:hypothetical protein
VFSGRVGFPNLAAMEFTKSVAFVDSLTLLLNAKDAVIESLEETGTSEKSMKISATIDSDVDVLSFSVAFAVN